MSAGLSRPAPYRCAMSRWFPVLCAVLYLGPWTTARAVAEDIGWPVEEVSSLIGRLYDYKLVDHRSYMESGRVYYQHVVTPLGFELVRDAMFDIAFVFTRTTDALLSFEGRREVVNG